MQGLEIWTKRAEKLHSKAFYCRIHVPMRSLSTAICNELQRYSYNVMKLSECINIRIFKKTV